MHRGIIDAEVSVNGGPWELRKIAYRAHSHPNIRAAVARIKDVVAREVGVGLSGVRVRETMVHKHTMISGVER